MSKSINRFTLALLSTFMWGNAIAHSWPENPRNRHPGGAGDCVTDELGATSWADKVGVTICGKDSQGVDIRNLRPSSYLSTPCTFTRADAKYTSELSRSVVEQGGLMCVNWAANAHDNDNTRDKGGGVRFAISEKPNPTMSDFDANVITYIPYDKFSGALLRIPGNLVPGVYTMLFSWDWPTGKGVKFLSPNEEAHLYARCMDIEIVAVGSQTAMVLGTHVNARYHGEGCGVNAIVYNVKSVTSIVDSNGTNWGGDDDRVNSNGLDDLINPNFKFGWNGWKMELGIAEIITTPSPKINNLGQALRLSPAEFGSKVTQSYSFTGGVKYRLVAQVKLVGSCSVILDIQNEKCEGGTRTCKDAGLLIPGGSNDKWPYNDEEWHNVELIYSPDATAIRPVIIEMDKYQSGNCFALVDNIHVYLDQVGCDDAKCQLFGDENAYCIYSDHCKCTEGYTCDEPNKHTLVNNECSPGSGQTVSCKPTNPTNPTKNPTNPTKNPINPNLPGSSLAPTNIVPSTSIKGSEMSPRLQGLCIILYIISISSAIVF